jgi:hypothetical protein
MTALPAMASAVAVVAVARAWPDGKRLFRAASRCCLQN